MTQQEILNQLMQKAQEMQALMVQLGEHPNAINWEIWKNELQSMKEDIAEELAYIEE